ncbi:DUF983 domain-containing protein [Sphingomonas xinjiangensis]|uniref:Uncharacterized protein (DUF983 family) n=1 Tax=Sphingomonas xinjiangensis TaxID=643568 RepID=A0A840YF32_9SPHN|nr:uncharacterized protein (DUF983 family) [Sphingomonas xinjiangensis]
MTEQSNTPAGGGGDQLPPPIASGLQGVCPRCSAKTLFRSYLAFADTCSNCGLDFRDFNVGDGPVVFLTLGIGTIVTILAVVVELAFEPGFLVHALLWLPLSLIMTVLTLRIAKGWLLALEFRNKAREGRIRKDN